MKHTTFLLLLSAVLAADVSAPIVGYSVQAARREVRVILGVPGSTHYSEPLAWPAEAASVRVTPGHRWLLALRGEDASPSVWIPESGVERSLAKVSGEPGLIAISPSGAAVAFYWRAAQRLVVYAGLPDAPVLAADFRTGDWASLAIGNSGRLVAGQSESGELRIILRDAEPMEKLVREARAVASYGFVGDDNTLAIVEPGSDRVELIGGVRDGSFTRRLLQLPAASTSSARLISGGVGWFSLVDPDGGVMYRLELAGSVRAAALAGIPVSAFESLRSRGATLLLPSPDDDTPPRIVLSHAGGDDLFYLPTLAKEQE